MTPQKIWIQMAKVVPTNVTVYALEWATSAFENCFVCFFKHYLIYK
jgi:hypothetical protein